MNSCCADPSCEVWQWCDGGSCSPQNSCWTGSLSGGCQAGSGWVSRGRAPSASPSPLPGPAPAPPCTDPRCKPSTDDSSWRVLNLPHDFVVEGNFTSTADKVHGYLPFGIGWYRKHITIPSSAAAPGSVLYIDVEGAQTASTIWLNGYGIGSHASGYTAARYFLNASMINFGADNLIALEVVSCLEHPVSPLVLMLRKPLSCSLAGCYESRWLVVRRRRHLPQRVAARHVFPRLHRALGRLCCIGRHGLDHLVGRCSLGKRRANPQRRGVNGCSLSLSIFCASCLCSFHCHTSTSP